MTADDASFDKLKRTLAGLTLPPQNGSATPSKSADKTYVFPSNDRKLEAVSLQTNDQGTTLTAKIQGVEQRIACGRGAWRPGRFAFGPLLDQPAAATGAWTEEDTFTAKICFYETPFILKVKLKFNGDELRVDSETNVGFGATKASALVGKAE